MSERKVLNKYYPPNFDPALIPKVKKEKDKQQKVRLMSPFSMRCETCGDYIYKGKKFNARKETVKGETYHSILIFRFYIRCPRCSAEITFKTDPKNADYVAEFGAVRNFEPWRDEDALNQELRDEKDQEEENNPLKALENRTLASKRELEIMEGLDEIRTRNARNERLDAHEILDNFIEVNESDEDELIAKEVFKAKRERELEQQEPELKEEETEIEKEHLDTLLKTSGIKNNWTSKPLETNAPISLNLNNGIVKKTKISENPAKKPKNNPFGVAISQVKTKVTPPTSKPSLSLLADYSDSDDES